MKLKDVLASLSVFVVFISVNVTAVKVCPKYKNYFFPSSSCYDNNETNLNATEILRKWGFNADEFNVYTDDGYQLLIIRAYNTITNQTPIVYAHGFLSNARTQLVMDKKSLAYQFLESGRQVFFINHRGTSYSQGHVNLTSNDLDYWKFSFHEMAQYDIPAILEVIGTLTFGQQVIWLGHSMGATTGITYATLYPDEAKANILGIIALGSGCFLGSTKSIPVKVFAPLNGILAPLGLWLWKGQFLRRQQLLPFLKQASKGPIRYWILYFLLSFIVGFNFEGISPEQFPLVALNTDDAVGLNVARHFAQLVWSGKYQYFDYGAKDNVVKYGTRSPPQYDLSKVTVPVAFYFGEGDILTTVEDGERTNNLLNASVRCGFKVIDDPYWTAFNFIDHKDQRKLLGEPILSKITAMEAGTC